MRILDKETITDRYIHKPNPDKRSIGSTTRQRNFAVYLKPKLTWQISVGV